MKPPDIHDAATGKVIAHVKDRQVARKAKDEKAISRISREIQLDAPPPAEPLQRAIYFAHWSERMQIGATAAGVMAGLALREVKRSLAIQRGPRKADAPALPDGCKGWGDVCEKVVGISEDSAGLYIALATKLESKLRKNSAVAALPWHKPSEWTDDQLGAVRKVVTKMTDGQTMQDLLIGYGILKSPKRGKGRGDGEGGGESAPLDPNEPDPGWLPEEWKEHCAALAAGHTEAIEAIAIAHDAGSNLSSLLESSAWAHLPPCSYGRFRELCRQLADKMPEKQPGKKGGAK